MITLTGSPALRDASAWTETRFRDWGLARVHGQKDAPPLSGEQPTGDWTTGEVTADGYTLTVDANAPEGQYRLILGWYEPRSGQRLFVGSDDYVEVAQWQLKRD